MGGCPLMVVPSFLGTGDGDVLYVGHFENRSYSCSTVLSVRRIFRVGIDISRFVTFLESFFFCSAKRNRPC